MIIGEEGVGTMTVSGSAVANANHGVIVGHCSGGTGTLIVTNGGTVATSSIYRGGEDGAKSHVTFDNATVKVTAAGDILKDIPDVTIGAGGLTLDAQTYAAVITNTTLKVTTGETAITMTGTGTLDLSYATVELSSAPTDKFTLATTTDGTFSGVPAVNGASGVDIGKYKAVVSKDRKRIEIKRPTGAAVLVF